jgi:hypothetical protein
MIRSVRALDLGLPLGFAAPAMPTDTLYRRPFRIAVLSL